MNDATRALIEKICSTLSKPELILFIEALDESPDGLMYQMVCDWLSINNPELSVELFNDASSVG